MTTTELARWTLGTVAAVLLAGPMTAAADPPDHAPAHGWRDKHERRRHDEGRRHYAGMSGRDWDDDYEISSGRCNRESVARASSQIYIRYMPTFSDW